MGISEFLFFAHSSSNLRFFYDSFTIFLRFSFMILLRLFNNFFTMVLWFMDPLGPPTCPGEQVSCAM